MKHEVRESRVDQLSEIGEWESEISRVAVDKNVWMVVRRKDQDQQRS